MSITPHMSPSVAPRKERAASSSPEQISISTCAACLSCSRSSSALAASRTALVANKSTCSAPRHRALMAMSRTASTVLRMASALRLCLASSPANSRVPSRSRSTCFAFSSSTSATSILTELEPIPMTAVRMVIPLSEMKKRTASSSLHIIPPWLLPECGLPHRCRHTAPQDSQTENAVRQA